MLLFKSEEECDKMSYVCGVPMEQMWALKPSHL